VSIIVITGANRGIGYETARQLIDSGHTVWMGARRADAGKSAAESLGGRFLQLDATDEESVHDSAERVRNESGHVDVLINNAGVLGGMSGADDLTADEIRSLFETNVFGVVRVVHAFVPLLRRSASPSIINVTSESGSFASVTDPNDPRFGVVSLGYASSKAALDMITVQYAKALPAMRVNAVAPGFTRTDFNGDTGTQTVAEGAEILVHLVEMGSRASTGKLLTRHGEIAW
jgi:NAD(P)-dependent dehydrogenase (short-subunit alcohol dehydrogenase family)